MNQETKIQAIEAIQNLKTLALLTPAHEDITEIDLFSTGIQAIAIGQILTDLAGNKITNPHLKEFEPIISQLKEMYFNTVSERNSDAV
jgi:hypothetical protein